MGIGIVDHQSISPDENGKGINAPFWNGNDGHFGYAIGRTKGGNNYKKKFKIGDVVTIELNRKSNGYITHNELRYYTNGIAESATFAGYGKRLCIGCSHVRQSLSNTNL